MILNSAKKKFQDADIDFLVDDIRVALLTSTHTTDIDTQEFFDDVSANEVSATGYTAGGTLLANKTTVVNNTNDNSVFDGDDITWSVTGQLTARYVVIYKDTGTPSTSPLISIIDLVTDKTVTDGDWTIQWSADGIISFD